MAKATTRKASIDRITLPDLADSDGALLRSGDGREAERYTGVDLGGRDLTGVSFEECEFTKVSLHETTLRGASFAECVMTDLHAPVLSAPRSSWRDVRIEHGASSRNGINTTASSSSDRTTYPWNGVDRYVWTFL